MQKYSNTIHSPLWYGYTTPTAVTPNRITAVDYGRKHIGYYWGASLLYALHIVGKFEFSVD